MPRPRPLLFEVRKPITGTQWRIVGFPHGKRTQYFFKTEKEARQAGADRNAEITAHGTKVSLSPVDRMRAINATERLAPFGKNIDDAVGWYLRNCGFPFSHRFTMNPIRIIDEMEALYEERFGVCAPFLIRRENSDCTPKNSLTQTPTRWTRGQKRIMSVG
jgi:hypothetical protein